ncbi:restriction endonuclease [Marine Group I thaumarchaeote]|uniref:Restriction endonuclease n=1 Tax=Marine Group I thaumarchaeote TaxID=2511932 RepID=A0A7K4MTZ6_9ARCH|nr:restriction endonuclease [Marine Group I thaumarchaeote]NWK13422.1 restriction endonuclease [Marine Group I thaumarchaeote]
MTFWLVRAGKHGEQEDGVLENNVVAISWNDLPDLSNITTKEEIEKLYLEARGPHKKMHVAQVVGQIWSFLKRINTGDLVALPLKRKSGIAIGEIVDDYEFKEIQSNIKHIRKVKWIKTFPRSSFDQDILFSLGAFLTVGRVRRDKAEERVRSMLKGEITSKILNEEIETETSELDLEQYSKDQITKFLEQKFAGHDLSRLINEILKAQGYSTKLSPAGPDGGVDVLAGFGSLGFGNPKICVQVKSSQTPIDVRIVRELEGVMKSFKADYGLLVAWGGINSKADQEMARSFFSIRLWDQDKIVEEIIKNYDKFDDSIKAELPLKKIWTLVDEPDD